MARDHFDARSSPVQRDTPPAGTSLPGCFSDEIAIDFPSVDEIVPRARDRFLGVDDTRRLTVHVSLSPHAARRGTTVPVDVPIRRTCDRCGGRGETWAEPCGACRGVGHATAHHAVRVYLPPGMVEGTRLRFRVTAPLAPPVFMDVVVAIGLT